MAAQLELDFNSVERVVEYLDLPQEAPAINEKCRPPAYWPSDTGTLEVEDLVIKYAENLPAVLKGVSFTVKPSEKIGVVSSVFLLLRCQTLIFGTQVGRTGSGSHRIPSRTHFSGLMYLS